MRKHWLTGLLIAAVALATIGGVALADTDDPPSSDDSAAAAASTTALTLPPAIIPVPGVAGLSSTLAALKRTVIS